MKRWGKQKPIRFDEKELKTDLGSGNIIFVGSSCDMFADDIPGKWIYETLIHCIKFNNTYLFQTKNPERILNGGNAFPKKSIFCTTIETNRCYPLIMNHSPLPSLRALWMSDLSYFGDTYVTIEPIMDFDLSDLIDLIKMCRPKKVNIGFNTSFKVKLPEPSKEKLLALIDELQKFTIIDKKNNLKRLL
jgi:hypothetical protein